LPGSERCAQVSEFRVNLGNCETHLHHTKTVGTIPVAIRSCILDLALIGQERTVRYDVWSPETSPIEFREIPVSRTRRPGRR
jgi:hypothetical protein